MVVFDIFIVFGNSFHYPELCGGNPEISLLEYKYKPGYLGVYKFIYRDYYRRYS